MQQNSLEKKTMLERMAGVAFNKVAGLQPATLLKSSREFFSVSFSKLFRIAFLHNTEYLVGAFWYVDH